MIEPKYNGKELSHFKAHYVCKNDDDDIVKEILTVIRDELIKHIKKTVCENKVIYELDIWMEDND